MFLLLLFSLFAIASTECSSSTTELTIPQLDDSIVQGSSICPFCPFTYTRNSELNAHFIAFHRNDTRLAHQLPVKFNFEIGDRPLATQTKSIPDRKFKCDYPLCKASFNLNHSLKYHALKHIKATFTCECGKKLSPLQAFLNHIQSEHTTDDQSMDHNGSSSTGQPNPVQQTHELVATTHESLVQPFQDEILAQGTPILAPNTICPTLLMTDNDCDHPDCIAQFSSPEALAHHQRTTFTHGYWWTCIPCNEQFATSAELYQHERSH